MATEPGMRQAPLEAGSFSTKYHRLITYAELAEHLGVSVRYVLILVKKGRIDRIKLGKRSVKFDLDDVMRRLKQGV